jgi:hypothetical protein
MTIEFELARAFTAQSKWADPKIIRGGRVELTADDIRAAVSMATNPVTFHAMMAKHCQDQYSERVLMEMIELKSWLVFGSNHPNQAISRSDNEKITESALIYFLKPSQGQRRGDAGNAAHMGCHRNTWASKYKMHFSLLTRFLFDCELRALYAIRGKLRNDHT